jgi:hypothetical protein
LVMSLWFRFSGMPARCDDGNDATRTCGDDMIE